MVLHDGVVVIGGVQVQGVDFVEGVQQLVLDGAVVQAAPTVQRHRLRVANASQVGVTPA